LTKLSYKILYYLDQWIGHERVGFIHSIKYCLVCNGKDADNIVSKPLKLQDYSFNYWLFTADGFKNLYFCGVKLLVAIFSLYILLLPAVPCRDTKECKEAIGTEKKASTGNHKEHEEACSPFCNCTCCGQVVAPLLQLNRVAIIKLIARRQQQFYRDSSLLSCFLGTIWQPPKV
jgi:hypothetical protein